MTTLKVPDAAMAAWAALNRALVGYEPPCQSNPDLWFATDPDDVRRAATHCRHCRVLTACGAYATAARESTGIWAGVNREPPRQPTKPTREDDP